MQPDLREAFERCAASDVAEARVAALVACMLDATLHPDAVQSELDSLASRCDRRRPPWQVLDGIGFAGNRDDYESIDNSNLAWVLANRRGIPISLGVVLIHVARAGGREAVGLNFPGHFLVDVDGTVVDPFVMQAVDVDGFLQRLPPDTRRAPIEHLFAPATPVMVGLRMLNNVKAVHARNAAFDRMLDVVDAQLALSPDQPALLVERGHCWQRLGLAAPARDAFSRALELLDAGLHDEADVIREVAESRLAELGDDGDVIH